MTREEILSKSRKENKGSDLVDFEIQSKSKSIAGAVTLFVCATINFIIGLMYGTKIPEFWVMFFGYNAVQGITTFILSMKKEKKNSRHVWLVYGIFMTVATVMAIIEVFRFYGQAS